MRASKYVCYHSSKAKQMDSFNKSTSSKVFTHFIEILHER